VQLMFTHNASEVLVIFAAILLGWPLPLLPLQILWLNLVTDIFPAFGLALEPPERGAMDRAPRPPNENLLSRDFLVRVAWQAGLLAAITLAIYWVALQRHGAGDVARTIALLSMVGVQLGQTFNCRSRTDSVFRGLSRSPYLFAATAAVVALQLFALAFAPLRDLLGLAVPPSSAWGLLALTVPLPIAIVEAQKWLARRSLPPLRAPVAS
jgi:Ca2+-transporting ATPase